MTEATGPFHSGFFILAAPTMAAAAPQIDLSRPQAEQTRTELTLGRLSRAWLGAPDGRRFIEAMLEFLRARSNPNTLRSYSYAVLEMFGWFEAEHARLPTPAEVRRADAVDFERWLRTRKHGLAEWYLLHDPARRLDAAIYVVCRERPGVSIDAIRQVLLGRREFTTIRLRDEGGRRTHETALTIEVEGPGLAARLAQLVDHKTLSRTPSVEQIRRGLVDVGLPMAEARRVGIDRPAPAEVFRYAVPTLDTEPAARASTICVRLAALSALWDYLMHTGENVGSSTPLLRINVWTELLRAAQRQAPSQQRVSRAEKTPGPALFEAILATTFRRRFGDGAPLAAKAQMDPRSPMPSPVPKAPKESFADLRDRAMMLLLAQTGIRAEELSSLTRADRQGAVITIRDGKGGRARQIGVPGPTGGALDQLGLRLAELVKHQERYRPGSGSSALLRADAPLLPVLERWGKNAGGGDRLVGISRQGIAMMLRRRAIAAGFEQGSADFARVHPHGLRHLFAHEAAEHGTAFNVIQAIMGHGRADTTMRYMEVHKPEGLLARGYATLPAAPPPSPATPPAARPAAPPPTPSPPSPPSPRGGGPSRAVLATRTAPPRRERTVVAGPLRIVPEEERPPHPVEPGERLVGHGEAPGYLPGSAEWAKADAGARLEAIYRDRWGEPGERERIKPSADIEAAPIEAELAAALGLSTAEAEAEASVAHHVYVGTHSGLLWWLGPAGRLDRAMPILSPGQMAGACGEDDPSSVCTRLGELWTKWMSERGRGPTAARALIAWIATSLRVSREVGAEIERRAGSWVGPAAPWEASAEPTERQVFREHGPEAVVAWFEAVAWQHRRSRAAEVLDEPLVVPAYYAEEDPVASVGAERAEMLDWLAALTGGRPKDTTGRFAGASRRELGELLGQMCTYDEQADLLTEMTETAPLGPAERAALEQAVRRASDQVDRTVRMLSRQIDPIRLEDAAKARRKSHRHGAREQRQAFYLRLLDGWFGPEAAADPALRLVALCGRVPLADERFADLFRIDWTTETIRHTREYARTFAKELGAHSECVARRLARDLWEMHKRDRQTGKERLLHRPDELVEHLDSAMAYKIPCPEALEAELRSALGTFEQLPVYETWSAARRAQAPTSGRSARVGAVDEEFRRLEEEYASAIGGEFAREYIDNPKKFGKVNARLPTAVHLVAACLVR